MKKKLTLAVLLSFIIVFSLSSIILAEDMGDNSFDAQLIDVTTEDSIKLDIKNIAENIQTKVLDDGVISVTKGYDIIFALPGLMNIGDSGNANGDLRAYINIDYDLRSDIYGNKEIRVNRCWGGWTIYNSYVVLDQREVYFTDGDPWNGHQSTNAPTSNTFDYSVSWSWVDYYPGTNYSGARAYTSTRVTVPGMGMSGYIFDLNLKL